MPPHNYFNYITNSELSSSTIHSYSTDYLLDFKFDKQTQLEYIDKLNEELPVAIPKKFVDKLLEKSFLFSPEEAECFIKMVFEALRMYLIAGKVVKLRNFYLKFVLLEDDLYVFYNKKQQPVKLDSDVLNILLASFQQFEPQLTENLQKIKLMRKYKDDRPRAKRSGRKST